MVIIYFLKSIVTILEVDGERHARLPTSIGLAAMDRPPMVETDMAERYAL